MKGTKAGDENSTNCAVIEVEHFDFVHVVFAYFVDVDSMKIVLLLKRYRHDHAGFTLVSRFSAVQAVFSPFISKLQIIRKLEKFDFFHVNHSIHVCKHSDQSPVLVAVMGSYKKMPLQVKI